MSKLVETGGTGRLRRLGVDMATGRRQERLAVELINRTGRAAGLEGGQGTTPGLSPGCCSRLFADR